MVLTNHTIYLLQAHPSKIAKTQDKFMNTHKTELIVIAGMDSQAFKESGLSVKMISSTSD